MAQILVEPLIARDAADDDRDSFISMCLAVGAPVAEPR